MGEQTFELILEFEDKFSQVSEDITDRKTNRRRHRGMKKIYQN